MHRRDRAASVDATDKSPGSVPAGARFRLQMLGGLSLLLPDENQSQSPLLRGRKLVLLAYLALSRRPIARDKLATFLWGHRDDERARHSLRDALSALRQVLGETIPRGLELIALSPDAPLDVDVLELREAARAGNHSEVVALYRGPFLDGVRVSDASEAEDWISEQRLLVQRSFVAACAAECRRLAATGHSESCAALALRWLEAEPTDASAFVWRLRALAAPDTPTALREALAEYARHAALLLHDYDETPAPAARTVCVELSDRLAASSEAIVVEKGPRPTPTPIGSVGSPQPRFDAEPTHHDSRPSRLRSRWLAIGAVAGIAAITLASVSLRSRLGAGSVDQPDLVVAGIESPSPAAEDKWLESGLPRLLASSLIRERVPGVADPSHVRAAGRRAGLVNSSGSMDGATALAVARRLHAATLVSGEITRGGGRFLLDLAIRDVASGTVRHRIAVSDTSLFGVVDQATARVLSAVDRQGSGFRFEDVETSSVAAYRAYVLALDRYDAGRQSEAEQLLDAAVSADSTFAAALQARRSMLTSPTNAGRDSARRLTDALSRVRGHESDFDKRAFAFTNAVMQGDAVHAEQLARDLVARFPHDSRAYGLLIANLQQQGHFAEAVEVATQALALDSPSRARAIGPCAKCAGLYGTIVTAALASGDAARALTAARRAVALNPGDPAPWISLARAMRASELPTEAIAAGARALQLAPREESAAEEFAWLLLEIGHLDAADSLIRDWARPGSDLASSARDLRAALWRERGQYDSATKAMARAIANARDSNDSASLGLVYASSLAGTGDVVAATRVFEQASRHPGDEVGGKLSAQTPLAAARTFTWPHALLADALALSGSRDTLRLLALADSIEIVGRRSGFGRDARLHSHIRGLVAGIGGRWSEAERLFERARWGRGGWTRTNVELARAQLAQGRPRDAITTLQDARFGTLGGMGRYAPHSEINASLVEAFLAAQMPDSARVYLERVRTAWVNADAQHRRRLADIERAVQAGSLARRIDHGTPGYRPGLTRQR
jgi:DNA-binding SARP family transcriptional activator/tetratricopeptide (TPR) repeat protein